MTKALRRGDLTRQPCEVCGAEPTQAHHEDYAKPLDVRWLCSKHHAEHHPRAGRGRKLTQGMRVNVTPEQRAELERIAERDFRSVAAVIRRAIREYLARDQKEES